ncbi:MAG: M16 family metallopeptidase, partial [Gemmatimonadales bacterium]
QVGGRRIYLVDKPGAAQSEIRIGRIGADRFTVDYYSLQVMNTILGGSFASRLNMNLREEHGYSYGARSSFSFRPTAGPFLASAAVQTDVTDSALVEFIRELNGILEPVSDEEIERGRNFVALRFPGRFQTVVGIANRLSELVTYNLPDDYFNRYIDNILAVTKDEVREVARDYLDSERMAIIVVGDRERILAGIEALQLGEIELFTIEDVLGPPPTIE